MRKPNIRKRKYNIGGILGMFANSVLDKSKQNIAARMGQVQPTAPNTWQFASREFPNQLNTANVNTPVVTGGRPIEQFRGIAPEGGGGFNLGKIGQNAGAIAPFVSNISNAFRRIPGPPRPTMESEIGVDLVNYDADRTSLDRTQQGINRGLDAMSANPGVANAQRAANIGKFLEAKGRINQQERNTNAMLKNQNRQVNQNVKARNVERENAFRNEEVARVIAQQQHNAQNLANASDKFQMMRQDKSLMDLEQRKIATIPVKYEHSGVVGRNLDDYLALEKDNLANFGLSLNRRKRKFGGQIARVLASKKK